MTLPISETGSTELEYAVPRTGLAIHIETFLARRILSGELPPGSTLPSQDDLVRQFGVSRAVVREAISALAQRGLLVVRHGRSTHVTDNTNWNVLDPFLVNIFAELGTVKKLFRDLFAVRLLIEPEAAAEVAAYHTPDQLRDIAEPLERLERIAASSSRTAISNADRDFHWRLTLAADNQVMTTIARDFQSLLWTQFGVSPFNQPGRVLEYHKAIYRAVEQSDPNGAREATRLHLCDARERFFRSLSS